MSPAISVVIPSYQRCRSLQAVLDALSQQMIGDFEVIVSLDGSTDDSLSMLESYDAPFTLRWVTGPNSGPGPARNRGGEHANANRLLFLDDDIIATPNLVANHISALRDRKRVVSLGQVRTYSGSAQTAWEQYLVERYEEHYDKLSQKDYTPTFWDCLGGNFALSRQLFDGVGGFDESFQAAKHDDIEFGYRLKQAGATFIFCEKALGYHAFHKDLQDGLNDAVVNGASAYRLAKRYPELRDPLLVARRNNYALSFRWLLDVPVLYRVVSGLSRMLLYMAYRFDLPIQAVYRLAYHMAFWYGVETSG